jgi:hypothetical protein
MQPRSSSVQSLGSKLSFSVASKVEPTSMLSRSDESW